VCVLSVPPKLELPTKHTIEVVSVRVEGRADLAQRRALADPRVKAHAAGRRAGRRPCHLRRLAARQGG
ncbi:hypothetical protein Q6331_30930, partial [Klebsiella pneumoniae]